MNPHFGILAFLLYCSTFVSAQDSSFNAQINDTSRVFSKAEIPPKFKNGGSDWAIYLRENLNSQVGADNGAPIGVYQVIVKFIISNTGAITQVASGTSFGYGMEQEAMRVIKNSPNWTPARQNGYPVNFYLFQPITFNVSIRGLNIITASTLSAGKENIVKIESNSIPVEFIELNVMNGNGTITPAGKGTFIIVPKNSGALYTGISFNTRRKKKAIATAYFNVQ